MQSLSMSQWIIIAVLFVLVAGASSLFTRAITNRGPKEGRVKERSATVPAHGSAAPISTSSAPIGGEHPSLKGWLLLLGILIFASPVVTGYWMWNAQSSVPMDSREMFPAAFYGQGVIFLAVIALELCTIVCLSRRSRRFKAFYVATSIALMLLIPVDLFWLAANFAAKTGAPISKEISKIFDLANIIVCIIAAIPVFIWLIYVIRSRQVANTFVR